jgi:hypothetical protein
MAHVSFISATKLIQLLSDANIKKNLHVHVLTTNQLALGVDPLRPTSVIDLSKEVLRSLNGNEDTPAPQPITRIVAERKASRKSGKYYLDFMGKIVDCDSLASTLAEGLKALEHHKPGTLNKLSGISPRSKRIVSRNRNDLFPTKKKVDEFTEKLVDGWYFGTNNSNDETKRWLERACEVAGVSWGKDLSVSF